MKNCAPFANRVDLPKRNVQVLVDHAVPTYSSGGVRKGRSFPTRPTPAPRRFYSSDGLPMDSLQGSGNGLPQYVGGYSLVISQATEELEPPVEVPTGEDFPVVAVPASSRPLSGVGRPKTRVTVSKLALGSLTTGYTGATSPVPYEDNPPAPEPKTSTGPTIVTVPYTDYTTGQFFLTQSGDGSSRPNTSHGFPLPRKMRSPLARAQGLVSPISRPTSRPTGTPQGLDGLSGPSRSGSLASLSFPSTSSSLFDPTRRPNTSYTIPASSSDALISPLQRRPVTVDTGKTSGGRRGLPPTPSSLSVATGKSAMASPFPSPGKLLSPLSRPTGMWKEEEEDVLVGLTGLPVRPPTRSTNSLRPL